MTTITLEVSEVVAAQLQGADPSALNQALRIAGIVVDQTAADAELRRSRLLEDLSRADPADDEANRAFDELCADH